MECCGYHVSAAVVHGPWFSVLRLCRVDCDGDGVSFSTVWLSMTVVSLFVISRWSSTEGSFCQRKLKWKIVDERVLGKLDFSGI